MTHDHPAILSRSRAACRALVAGLASAAIAAAQPSLYWAWVGKEGEYLGATLAPAGDLDGDGRDEILIGNPETAKGPGTVLVVSPHDGTILFQFTGKHEDDRYGKGLAMIGDVDNDGFGDIAIGAPDHGLGGGSYCHGVSGDGRVEVRSGRTGGVIHEQIGDVCAEFGHSIAALGEDVTGDGVPDYIVGSPGQHSQFTGERAGRVGLYSGKTGSNWAHLTSYNAEPGQHRFGLAVATVGDVNGDGRVDFAAGAPFHSGDGSMPHRGVVCVYDAETFQPLGVTIGMQANDLAGWSLAAAGDVDGDGHDDYMVGAPLGDVGAVDAGYAMVISGRNGALLALFWGTAGVAQAGVAVGRPGDFDGDGVADFAVGAPTGGADSHGRVHLYSGATLTKLWELGSFTPSSSAAWFGGALASAGDLDGNGTTDLAVGGHLAFEGNGLVETVLLDWNGWRR